MNEISDTLRKNVQEETGLILEPIKYGSPKSKSSGSNRVSFVDSSYYILMMYRFITLHSSLKKQTENEK